MPIEASHCGPYRYEFIVLWPTAKEKWTRLIKATQNFTIISLTILQVAYQFCIHLPPPYACLISEANVSTIYAHFFRNIIRA